LKTYQFYLFVVATVATCLALFERWGIARFNVGWGEPLPANTFWGKPVLEKAPFNLAGAVLLTRYHFVMFFVLVPMALTVAILILKNSAAHPPATWLAWIFFLIACVFGVMVLEDFLFFVFSSLFRSPYPHALARLLRGEATWHPQQINFGWFKLPAFYVYLPPVIASLLWLESRLNR
jgi:hypothetical protein